MFIVFNSKRGKKSFERYKFKYLGGKAGVPDVLIFKKNSLRAV